MQEYCQCESGPNNVSETLFQNQNKNKRTGGIVQKLEHRQHKALGSISSTWKENKNTVGGMKL
jgi:hypothetical protein